MAGASRDGPRSGPEGLFKCMRGGTQSGRQSEEQAARKRRGDCEQQRMPIQVNLFSARQTTGPEDDERPNPDGCQQDAEHTSEQAQYSALGQTLADQSAAACSQRYAHGEFTLARNCAGQQQAGDIRAGDQQHEADRPEEQPERGPDISNQVLAKRLDLEDTAGIRLRILLSQVTADNRQLGLSSGQRDSRLEAGHNVNEGRRAIQHTQFPDLADWG